MAVGRNNLIVLEHFFHGIPFGLAGRLEISNIEGSCLFMPTSIVLEISVWSRPYSMEVKSDNIVWMLLRNGLRVREGQNQIVWDTNFDLRNCYSAHWDICNDISYLEMGLKCHSVKNDLRKLNSRDWQDFSVSPSQFHSKRDRQIVAFMFFAVTFMSFLSRKN